MHIQFPLVQQYLGTSQARQYRYRYRYRYSVHSTVPYRYDYTSTTALLQLARSL
jgi:hypothetical protein